MNAADILERLGSHGVNVEVQGQELLARPGSKVPHDLIPMLMERKADIVDHLQRQDKDRLKARFRPASRGTGSSREELREITRQVEAEGYCLLYSHVLHDLVAFHQNDIDPSHIPPGFVRYSEAELRELFGDDKPEVSESALQLIHTAKVLGARVTGNYPKVPLPQLLERLRNGARWLRDEHRRLLDDDPHRASHEVFSTVSVSWDQLETTLRQLHHYEGCVMGHGKRCPEGGPMRCSACVV